MVSGSTSTSHRLQREARVDSGSQREARVFAESHHGGQGCVILGANLLTKVTPVPSALRWYFFDVRHIIRESADLNIFNEIETQLVLAQSR